ncbi:MAG TPA: peptidylprolyl isomerase [Desulfobacteraceae bacterium]|nr:peptidylprolyl isomerase [Deltaproteobacteria bacterium]MBW2355971.1 peptidylprolyl isomerase [Deltaproteobacteria bacterium]HDI58957.1 peptidylprolyl isomerase [Desulfobacteraceae bacterium]
MEQVENGVFVSVEYTGTLSNGEVFDTSRDRQPLEVHMGAGRMIPGFEKALLGMTLNEKKTFTLEAEEAYGSRDDRLMREFPRSSAPPGAVPEVGQLVGLQTPDGQQIPAKIVKVDDQNITLDMNHPLAGESLTFEVEVVGISDTPTQLPEACGDGGCDCCSGCD